MEKLYVVTGAAGHLGNTLVRMLAAKGEEVRGLLLPGEKGDAYPTVAYIVGDVRDKDSLRPLFAGTQDKELYVLHTAGIIDIADSVSPQIQAVNVDGTANVLSLCGEYGVKRLLYVSSVHAIPEGDPHQVLRETDHFSPDEVHGGYAKTKAQATQLVLDAAAQGLDAVVVHPSGILGPYDRSHNHLVQMVNDYAAGRLPACVKGGYDFVDVRDVADGCLRALEQGRAGACYILSNRHYEVREVLRMVRAITGTRPALLIPTWMAKAALPLIRLHARTAGHRPLYTKYSLYTLHSNDKFSHDKATRELGYLPRDLRDTLRDMLAPENAGPAPDRGKKRRRAAKTALAAEQ